MRTKRPRCRLSLLGESRPKELFLFKSSWCQLHGRRNQDSKSITAQESAPLQVMVPPDWTITFCGMALYNSVD
jgi:hypothetical protein